ncbi:MAG: tRNA (adenosine(37)-N6)-dimethylallyltransferase MiaA [bacterium]
MKKKVIVILGQTATGKSDLAVKLALRLCSGQAKKNGGEIISADSRQVYIGLDIGTGKITKKEMRGIPHHLLDVVNPKNKFTVTEYQQKTIYAMTEIFKKGKTPIICGGTGFYIDAITKGTIFPEVPPNIKLRKLLEKKSSAKLFSMLLKLDKKRANDIKNKNEINNKVRLIRAIEIARALGEVPNITEATPPYEFIKIGLFLPDEILKKKVNKRVTAMFQNGLLKEIIKLKKEGISQKRLMEFGFEYDNPTKEKVILETIKYAKRQMTWFKRDKEIIWFDASKSDILGNVVNLLKINI